MLHKSFYFKISEGCCDEQYPSRREGKGKIAFDPRFFREENKWHGVAPNDKELEMALKEIDRD